MQNSSPNYLQSRLFVQYLDIAHGFSGRLGGVSRGAYSSLNCGLGSNDDPDSIRENRRIVASRLDLAASALSTPWQVHGDVVRTLDGPLLDTEPPSADGVVTATPGVALGVSTADCVPVLFADPGAGVIGAAHAGWRGTLSGIVAATVDAMIALGAERARISAGIGPAIQQQSYEVGAELRANFLADNADHRRFFTPGGAAEKHLFDLPGFVAQRLTDAGVRDIKQSRMDTLSDPENYFSYRRSQRLGEPDYGRQLSVIALR